MRELVTLEYVKRQRQYPCSLDRYDEPKMGKEYHERVNRDMAKYDAKAPPKVRVSRVSLIT